jgi:hypothetical protein
MFMDFANVIYTDAECMQLLIAFYDVYSKTGVTPENSPGCNNSYNFTVTMYSTPAFESKTNHYTLPSIWLFDLSDLSAASRESCWRIHIEMTA